MTLKRGIDDGILPPSKKLHEQESASCLIKWHSRDGILVKEYTRSFLAEASEFFAGLFRTSYEEEVNIKMPYPASTIENLFLHLDGECVNLTERGEGMLASAINFLILNPPYDTIQNLGYDRNICYWCSKEADDTFCTSKRWTIVQGRQQCLFCCDMVQFCDCDHSKNLHDDNEKRVAKIKGLVTRK